MSYTNWRDDPGLECREVYKRKFAIFPVKCTTDTVWLKRYYKLFKHWGHRHKYIDKGYGHIDFIENITEEEYICRKLSGKIP